MPPVTVAVTPTRSTGSGGRSKEERRWTPEPELAPAVAPSASYDDGSSFPPIHRFATPSPTPSSAANGPHCVRSVAAAAARRVGSGSRDQWDALESEPEPERRPPPPRATTELDRILGPGDDDDAALLPSVATPSTDDADVDDDVFDADRDVDGAATEASFVLSEVTAVTGNVGGASVGGGGSARATPGRRSPSPRGGAGSRGGRRGGRERSGRGRPSFEADGGGRGGRRPLGLACGAAVPVKEELRESFRDANDVVRQIVATVRNVRHFGPDEKDAVRETLGDVRSFVGGGLRRALSCREDRTEDRTDVSSFSSRGRGL